MTYDLAVFIGRFQPLHSGHMAVIRQALEQARYLLIVVGGANQPRRWDLMPFTDAERVAMIRNSLTTEENARIVVTPLEDSAYNDDDWVVSVQVAADLALLHFDESKFSKIALIGHSKDKSSYYLKMFPQWDSIEVPFEDALHATQIREQYLRSDTYDEMNAQLDLEEFKLAPEGTIKFLQEFWQTPEFRELCAERTFMLEYLAGFDSASYPPNFVTVDNVVIQAGHVLLVQRKARPGKDLWALPGGHINHNESKYDAAVRELEEETRIKVPLPVLKQSLIHREEFDHPLRSTRKRTYTTAFLFHLRPEAPKRSRDHTLNGWTETEANHKKRIKDALALPKVKAADDAKRAVWVPLSDVKPNLMFEDHYRIIRKFEKLLDRGL